MARQTEWRAERERLLGLADAQKPALEALAKRRAELLAEQHRLSMELQLREDLTGLALSAPAQ